MEFVMPRLEWDESYSVKVGAFNDQHKLLFDYINDLRDSMLGKKGHDTVAETLNALLDYTNTHFFNEEILLYKNEYPDYEKHKAAHDQFLSDVRGFYVRFHAGKVDSRLISAEIIAVVTELLQEHILKADKAYADFLNAKGIK